MLVPVEMLISETRQKEFLREAEQARLARQVIKEMRKHGKHFFDRKRENDDNEPDVRRN